jgi:hypothetical protein
MNRISNTDFKIVTKKNNEDKIADKLRGYDSIYKERLQFTDTTSIILKARILAEVKKELPDILPDFSNFDRALIRWSRKIKSSSLEICNEIYEWLQEPNHGTTYAEFAKKYTYDYMIHGSASAYKNIINEKLENFENLPGGTILKLKPKYFSTGYAFVQVTNGYDYQVFFSDEIAYAEYLPVSHSTQGMIPLEALISMVAENLLYNDKMAKEADGTKKPEKIIVVTRQSAFEGMNSEGKTEIELPPDEQARIDEKIKSPVKGAVMTLTGNTAQVLDIGNNDNLSLQNARQKDIREECAFVFSMTNMEVNLGGSDQTSGRSTAEVQQEIEQGKGAGPIFRSLQNFITTQILPYRYGVNYLMQYDLGMSEKEQVELDILKLQSGELTQNELRELKNKPLFNGQEFDMPKESAQVGAGDSEINPVYMKSLN